MLFDGSLSSVQWVFRGKKTNVLKTRVIREGRWTEIPPHERAKVMRTHCSICGLRYGQLVQYHAKGSWVYCREALDHILPRRFLEMHGIYAHDYRGLLSICTRDHGLKKGFEDRLFQGDVFGFLSGLQSIGYPMDRVIAFAALLGLKEFSDWRI